MPSAQADGQLDINSNFTVFAAPGCIAGREGEPFQGGGSFEVGKGFEDMSGNRTENANILQEEIRRQFGSVGTTRYVKTLPPYQVEHRIPERLANLLSELERREADRGVAGHSVSNGAA